MIGPQDCEIQCPQKCNQCKQCQKFLLWNQKQFQMGMVMPIFSKSLQGNKYVLLKSAKTSLKMKFEELLESKTPYVMIFASCYSHRSKINNILHACGLYSALRQAKYT